jgi:predicted benzoate:H+ symporter BenE
MCNATVARSVILIIVSLVLLILAVVLFFIGNLARESARLAGLLVVLMLVQWILVEAFSDAAPALAALHPVNGFLVLIVAGALALGFRLPLTTERSRSRA